MQQIVLLQQEKFRKTPYKRLEWGNSWAKSQIDQYIYAFNHDITEIKIITDHRTVDSIVEEIAEKSGVTLLNDKRGSFKKSLIGRLRF